MAVIGVSIIIFTLPSVAIEYGPNETVEATPVTPCIPPTDIAGLPSVVLIAIPFGITVTNCPAEACPT